MKHFNGGMSFWNLEDTSKAEFGISEFSACELLEGFQVAYIK
jgi:hypothetical protein